MYVFRADYLELHNESVCFSWARSPFLLQAIRSCLFGLALPEVAFYSALFKSYNIFWPYSYPPPKVLDPLSLPNFMFLFTLEKNPNIWSIINKPKMYRKTLFEDVVRKIQAKVIVHNNSGNKRYTNSDWYYQR